MRRILLVLCGVMVTSAVAASPAVAANPHFIGTPKATVSGNSLIVTFKAAGLGNAPTANFELNGTVDVFSRCYNHGGNKPQADNKQETINVAESGEFPVRNGQTTGSFTITPLSTLTCPGNQVVKIESISWDLTLSGEGLSYHLVGHNP
jgi:hypothetical protein